MKRESAQDEVTIERELRNIEKHFSRRRNRSDQSVAEIVIVAIVGDQPMFRLWLESYLGLSDSQLCKWMVPLPGGFHIDKQGIIPTVKIFLAGSGLEELAEFSWLSSKHKNGIVKLAHYRKNRRFLSQVVAAMILRISDVICGIDHLITTSRGNLPP